MKKISTAVLSALGIVAFASACSVEMGEPVEELGSEEQGAVVCSNDQATNAIAASMAVVMAREVGRWMPKVDLTQDWNGNLALTQAAINRCNARVAAGVPGATANCRDMNFLLGLQWGSSGMQFGGAQLTDSNVLKSRLVSYWDRQKQCSNDQNGDQGQPNQCPSEGNELTMYRATTSGSTCAGGKDYWYKAVYAAGHSKAGQPLSGTDAAQLRNNLKWAGEAPGTGGNQFLQFELDANVAGDVKIDPLDENQGGGTGSTGVAEAAPNHVWTNNSYWKCDTVMAKTVGAPCTCGGTPRNWKTAVKAGFFHCNP